MPHSLEETSNHKVIRNSQSVKQINNKTMKQTNLVVKFIRQLLLNAKWIMLGILLLNLFVFGYLRISRRKK